MRRPVHLLPDAGRELEDAFWWYERQRSGLGLEFLLALGASSAFCRPASNHVHFATRLFLGALMLAGSVVFPGAAIANGPNVGFDAGGIVPLQNGDVQLVSETVDVPVSGGEVRCEYVLRNLTKSHLRLRMAFVTSGPGDVESEGYSRRIRAANLRVSRGGESLAVHLAPVAKDRWRPFVRTPPDSLPVWSVAFEPSQEVRLHISYEVEPSGGCDGRDCDSGITYYAASARLWAGKVQAATIRFRFSMKDSLALASPQEAPKGFALQATPPGFTIEPGMVRWNLHDWEPQENFSVSIRWMDPE